MQRRICAIAVVVTEKVLIHADSFAVERCAFITDFSIFSCEPF